MYVTSIDRGHTDEALCVLWFGLRLDCVCRVPVPGAYMSSPGS